MNVEIEEKSEEFTDNFLKKLQEIALKAAPQHRPYKQKTVITAKDVTHIDKAMKTIRKG
ncbi:MAG: hypothetical protein RSB82_04965 [Victivallaceae bacterium]